MTLLFMDGFDHYDTADIIKKWDSASLTGMSIHTDFARFPASGKQGCRMSSSSSTTGDKVLRKYLVDSSTLIVGFAYYTTGGQGSSSNEVFFKIYDDVTIQIKGSVNTDGTISVYNGSNTLLGTTSNVLEIATWYYIEFKILFSATVGTVDIHVSGLSWLSLTSKVTQISGNDFGNIVILATNYNDRVIYVDDVYICDALGTENNDFLGDVRIYALHPNGAGTHTDFTPSAGANYENVDDPINIDDDSTYNSHNTIGEKDSYALGDLPTDIGVIHGIQINTTVKKDDAGDLTVKPFVRAGTTDYPQGSNLALSDSYVMYGNISEENPDDSSAWEKADIDALETGIEIIS